MNARMALPAFLTALSMWVVAGLWHNLILPGLYDSLHAEHDGIGVLAIAYVILAILMVYLAPRNLAEAGPTRWFVYGATIGLLWVFPHGLAMAGAHGGSLTYVFKNAAWHALEQGIGGLVLGTALRWAA